jgi:hypothetical protein
VRTTPDIDYAEKHHPPAKWRILGVELLPYRTGHKNLLLARRSPFVCKGEKDFDISELLFAVWVCSRPYHEAAKGLTPRWKFWALRMALKLKRNELLFWPRVEMFIDYLCENHQPPKGMRANAEGEKTLAPSLLIFKRDLLTRYTVEEFWELPMAVAIADRDAILELDGTVSWKAGWEVDSPRINQDEEIAREQAEKSARPDIGAPIASRTTPEAA